MTKRNRSRSGARVECPHCGRKLRGEKGLKMHVAEAHGEGEDIVRLVEREYAAFNQITASPTENYDTWRAQRAAVHATVTKALVNAGAALRENGDVTAISLGGLRASSTTGLSGALGNWLKQARGKIDGSKSNGR